MNTIQGATLKNSTRRYLSKNNCQEDMNSAKEELEQEEVDDNQLSGTLIPEEGLAPSPLELAQRVFRYVLQFELEERVRKFCPACIRKLKGEKAHQAGCKASIEDKAKIHGPSAGNRISSARLYESCMSISNYYIAGQYVSTSDVQEAISSAKVVELLLHPQEEEEFESEYSYLKLI